MKLIEQGWLSYRREVIPKDAPLVQLQECRRVFYAGAACFFALLTGMVESGEEVTADHMQALQELSAELDDFVKAVEDGIK